VLLSPLFRRCYLTVIATVFSLFPDQDRDKNMNEINKMPAMVPEGLSLKQ
jgi:hypothetical protein